MFAAGLTVEWAAWVAALAAPLHRRSAWRLAHVVLGLLLAHGRRTIASWWRAANIGPRYGVYYYFLTSGGHKATIVAAVLFALLRQRIDPGGRLLLAINDTPTKRYGPQVQGAGVHHHPTPGPAGSKFLYGPSWVVLSRVVRHERSGTIGLPLLGRLYIRDKSLPKLPEARDRPFRTKPQLAGETITWATALCTGEAQPPWVIVDGAYANREVIKPAKKAGWSSPVAGGCLTVRPTAGARARSEAGPGPPADLRQEPAQSGQAGGTAAGLADGRYGDDDGPGGHEDGQDLPGDVAPGWGTGSGGDRQGVRRIMAGLSLYRPGGERGGDRPGDRRSVVDRAELPRLEGSRRN
ncbi:MAG: transposase [Isosphaeraceae bacterium]|nr:transposase [Isosphaeraceae bacterium]